MKGWMYKHIEAEDWYPDINEQSKPITRSLPLLPYFISWSNKLNYKT